MIQPTTQISMTHMGIFTISKWLIFEIEFNLEIESSGKTRSIAKNVCRVLVKKKVLILVTKENDTINN